MTDTRAHWADGEDAEFLRLPGLFRRWEIERIVEAGPDFHFEEAGTTSDGAELFAVYRRDHAEGADDLVVGGVVGG